MRNKAFLTIAVICITYLITGLIHKPVISNDAAYGMISLNNYLLGGGWNKQIFIDQNGNAFENKELTWWAPGQYYLPYVLSKVSGVNIGSSVLLALFISLIAGCYAYYKLFKHYGIDDKIVLIALLILVFQRFINIFFLQYNSSDLFLFLWAPCYVYAYLHAFKNYSERWVSNIMLLVALNAVGSFIKNSAILFEVAVNAFVFLEFVAKKNNGSFNLRGKKMLLFAAFVIPNLFNYYFILRLGANPSNGAGLLVNITTVLTGLFIPLAEILFGSLSISGIFGNFANHLNLNTITANAAMLAGSAVICTMLYKSSARIKEHFKTDLLFRLVVTLSLMYLLFWFVFTLKQSAISNEDRLYLPITILVLPYLLYFVLDGRTFIKYIFGTAMSLSVLFGCASFVLRLTKYSDGGAVHSKNTLLSGFRVFSENKDNDEDVKNVAGFISSKGKNSIIVIPYPDIAFELNIKNRISITPVGNIPAPIDGMKPHYLVLTDNPAEKVPVFLNKVYFFGQIFCLQIALFFWFCNYFRFVNVLLFVIRFIHFKVHARQGKL